MTLVDFFYYLTFTVDHILSFYPFAEILIIIDFNVHHQFGLSFPFTDYSGELAFEFAILHDLEQLVQSPTRISQSPIYTPKILDLFFNYNSSAYHVTLFFYPMASFVHNPVFVSCPISPFHLQDPPKQRRMKRFASANLGYLRRYYANFPWNYYCFCVRDP